MFKSQNYLYQLAKHVVSEKISRVTVSQSIHINRFIYYEYEAVRRVRSKWHIIFNEIKVNL